MYPNHSRSNRLTHNLRGSLPINRVKLQEEVFRHAAFNVFAHNRNDYSKTSLFYGIEMENGRMHLLMI